MPDILDTLDDAQLLGPYFEGASWDRWRACLKAAFGLPMTPEDLCLFAEVAGDRAPPGHSVRELVAVVGRGGGKDAIASAIATHLAVSSDFRRLRPGERGTIMCVACDRDQAAIALGYIRGYFERVPLLAAMVERSRDDFIDLRNGASITVTTNSHRAPRGRTIVAAILDEAAFFRSEDSASPDFEVDAAISPGLARWPGSMKIIISSAYRRAGLLFERWKAAYGQDDPDTLAVLGTALQFNPLMDAGIVERELERDYERASAEYLSQWRSDIADFVSRDVIEALIPPGCFELPYSSRYQYSAFVDPSGGSSDSFTLAIAHTEDDGRGVLDLIREYRAPFSPEAIVEEICAVLKAYGIHTVSGDKYAGQWPAEQFAKRGISYEPSEKSKSDLYRELLPLLNSRRVELLDNPRLVAQLCSLERRVGRGTGRDVIDHPAGAHDDVANAVAGALVLVAAGDSTWRDVVRSLIGDEPIDQPPPQPQPQPPQPQPIIVAGPGEVLVDLPYPITVQFRYGAGVHLRGGLQAVPLSLGEHPIVKRFVVREPEAA
jgi:hypothetical protein